MSVRNAVVGACMGVALGTTAAATDDAAASPRTRWGCHVAEQHLVCFVERSAPSRPVPTLPRGADARLPALVRELRHHPASWRGRTLRIPLHNEPFPDSPLQALAQAVLCGAAPDCEAVIGLERGSSQTAWLDFADAHGPLLQGGE